jgi:FAD synthetase
MSIIAVAGNFDPIHEGHIDHLEKAAQLKGEGDKLIVILAREDQVIRKKGYSFYGSFRTRYKILKHFTIVDGIVANIDQDLTCADTLRWLKPDIFAKGGDRIPDNMPLNEIKVCEEIGCKIEYGIGDLLNSSSALVKKSRQSETLKV